MNGSGGGRGKGFIVPRKGLLWRSVVFWLNTARGRSGEDAKQSEPRFRINLRITITYPSVLLDNSVAKTNIHAGEWNRDFNLDFNVYIYI